MAKKKKQKTIDDMKSWGDFKTTDEISVPKKLIDQVIGQEKAVAASLCHKEAQGVYG